MKKIILLLLSAGTSISFASNIDNSNLTSEYIKSELNQSIVIKKETTSGLYIKYNSAKTDALTLPKLHFYSIYYAAKQIQFQHVVFNVDGEIIDLEFEYPYVKKHDSLNIFEEIIDVPLNIIDDKSLNNVFKIINGKKVTVELKSRTGEVLYKYDFTKEKQTSMKEVLENFLKLSK
jgi:hypothetical protein